MKKVIIPTIVAFALFSGCGDDTDTSGNVDYKQEMRNFVTEISQYAKANHPGFYIIPQNGIELVTDNGEQGGSPNTAYLDAIDGNGQEGLFYGYEEEDQLTASADNAYLKSFLDISKNAGNMILVTDYCHTAAKIDNSYNWNQAAAYVSFAADHLDLDNIPAYPDPIFNVNNGVVISLPEVKNFLYLIDPANYPGKNDFINAITATDYDLLIMDLFFDEEVVFTPAEVEQLRSKSNGGKRLVIAYMSIGEAEDYRYYWQAGWSTGNPSWLDEENPDWPGNYKVRYWDPGWKQIIFGNDSSYLKKILDAGFDGVYLDIIDAFEYYE